MVEVSPRHMVCRIVPGHPCARRPVILVLHVAGLVLRPRYHRAIGRPRDVVLARIRHLDHDGIGFLRALFSDRRLRREVDIRLFGLRQAAVVQVVEVRLLPRHSEVDHAEDILRTQAVQLIPGVRIAVPVVLCLEAVDHGTLPEISQHFVHDLLLVPSPRRIVTREDGIGAVDADQGGDGIRVLVVGNIAREVVQRDAHVAESKRVPVPIGVLRHVDDPHPVCLHSADHVL